MKDKIYTALMELYEGKAISLETFSVLCDYKDIIVTILEKVNKLK